jgi:hypothetical protein
MVLTSLHWEHGAIILYLSFIIWKRMAANLSK